MLASSSSSSFCNHHDTSALLLFKNSLNTPFKLETLKKHTDCSEWDGVTCDTISGHVIGLDLSFCNLQGQLHPNCTIFSLSHLQRLNLAKNEFFGDIPSIISCLSKLLFLDLSSNYDSRRMRVDPYTWNKLIQNATNLRELYLDDVDMSSIGVSSLSLLTNLSSSLISLSLVSTELQGNLWSHILSLPNLQMLDLSFNKDLGGELPKSNWSTPLSNLALSHTAFSGNIPDSIGHLKSLNTLYLWGCNFDGLFLLLTDNKLNGTIPRWCYSLPSLLELDLSNNLLTGSIGEFSSYSLEYLSISNNKLQDLSHNNIRGSIPQSFHEKLLHSWNYTIAHIDLSFNKLQGDLPIPPNGIEYFLVSNDELTGNIPSAMCNASTLNILNLAHNNLTGQIPQCLSTFPYLSALDLQMNNLYGNIPWNFSKGNAFETIKLNGNQFDGPLPRSLAHCTNLEVLDLTGNNIEDTFPHWLESLQELQVFSLRSNKFHGVITSFGAKYPFPRLRIFYVSNNNFSGPLPASYIKNFQGMVSVNDNQTGLKYMGNQNLYNDSVVVVMKGRYMELERILSIFTTIDLSNNMFEGELPKVIGELHSLKGLNLSHNAITGTIPGSFGNLRNLEWLDLSWNQLKGEIPVALINLNFLAVLNLSQNHFEGIIPTGGQFNTFENDSYAGNQMLCGFPLSKSCNKDEDWPPYSTFHHEESGFGWKAVAVGYSCGLLFGMLLGYNVFMTGKPQWLARLVEELSKQGTFDKGQGPLYFQFSLVHEESTSSIQTTDKVKQGRTTHSGVLEFTADQGSVGLPPHVWNNLFSEGTSKPPLVDVRYVWLPKGTYSKLHPERVGFSDLPNHKAILETCLRQHATLSQGDILTVNNGELAYKLRVEHQASVFPLRLITCQFCGDMVQAGRSAMNVRDRLRGLSERSVMLKDMDIHRIVVHQSG
ncbi:Receptor-like protein 9DC3 [Glycine max]|nr:Receptor-like protein 9DC3 [Glycine max]